MSAAPTPRLRPHVVVRFDAARGGYVLLAPERGLELNASAAAEEWLAIGPAARRAGVSVDTVRRRIRDGSLPARKVASRHGPAWEVRLDVALRLAPEGRSVGAADGGAAPELRHLVADLMDRNCALAEEIGRLRARLEATEALLNRVGSPGA